MPTSLRETDLYGPIHDYLVTLGYTVQGEVKGCDIAASKGDDLIVIELKRRFSTRLLVQAIDRQRITDSVYVALPGPLSLSRGSRWQAIKRLLRRLELGLIVVTFTGESVRVEVVFHPLPYQRRRMKRRKRAVLQEMASRTGSYNEGGSTRKKVITAYRENAIHIACCLEMLGSLAPSQLRALGTGPKTGSILASDFYGWFRRVERGIYEITPSGMAELAEHEALAEQYRKRIDAQRAQGGMMVSTGQPLDALLAQFDPSAGVVRSTFFGTPCLKAGGKVFAVSSKADMVFKLSRDARAGALQLSGACLWDKRGKGHPMKEWVQIPVAHSAAWDRYAGLAYEYVVGAAVGE